MMARRAQHPGGAASPVGRSIVLVGAGHSHLHILKQAGLFAARGYALTVIAPDDFWYSGAASGVLSGQYRPDSERIDIAALIAGSGATLIRSRLAAIDRAARRLVSEDGTAVPFDVVSLNLGSAPVPLPGDNRNVFDVKPVAHLDRLRGALETRHQTNPKAQTRIAIVGGGLTGFEIAASLERLGRRLNAPFSITVHGGDRPLADLAKPIAAGVIHALRRRGIAAPDGSRVVSVDDGVLTLADGRTEPADFVVNASGLAPAPVIAGLGLPLAGDGSLHVDPWLRSTGDPAIFAAGDCIAFDGEPLPRVGVYAVRQAPVILHNMLATLEGTPLMRFEPQKNFLTIMNLGDDTGLALRAGLHWRGRLAWRLKDAIDRRFLASHRPDPTPATVPADRPELSRSQS